MDHDRQLLHPNFVFWWDKHIFKLGEKTNTYGGEGEGVIKNSF